MYRKLFLAKKGMSIVKKDVKKIISDSPTKLWNKTCKYGGIDSVSYNKYFDKCDVAYAYVIDKVVLYDNPKNLKDFGIVNVPQSFVYVNK